tara:strand:+ start:2554 stop:3897 length:1344 start_codon:yes stop_codon:yes gene_type:complete
MTEENKMNPFMGMKEQQAMEPQLQVKELPDEVRERIKKHSERTGETYDDVKEYYLTSIKEIFSCDDWEVEDEDLLIDWTESVFVQSRKGSTQGSNTSVWVGHFLGVDGKVGNRGEGLINWLIRTFRESPNDFFATGNGHYEAKEGMWTIKTQDSVIDTGESTENPPSVGINVGGNDYVAFVSKNGYAYSRDEMGRYSWFLGHNKDVFQETGDMALWRVDMKDDDTQRAIRVGEPCMIQVMPPKDDETNDFRKTILNTREGFVDTIQYTNDFVDEDEKKLLNPSTFWVDSRFHDYFVPLEDFDDAFRTKKEVTAQGNAFGPLVTTKGRVVRMSTESRESEYDEDGRSYSFSISSQALQSNKGVGRGSEVFCNVGSAVHDLTNVFSFRDADGELMEYAEGTVLYLFGRVGMMQSNGEEYPKLKVMGVYANPRLARRRVGGGDTDTTQFR